MSRFLLTLIFALLASTVVRGQEPSALTTGETENGSPVVSEGPGSVVFPDLTIPAGARVEDLNAIIRKAQAAQPRSPDQYQQMQTAIRDASRQILIQLRGQEESPQYRQAELDSISSSVALITFFGEDARQKTMEQVHDFLKKRKQLELRDVQMGMMAAAMLELQPNKKPARDTYELLDERLKEDEREEMQSLRINLQASVRRLNLLGSKLELAATAIDGKKIEIDDFAGKFVLVDFFATWCEPCMNEMPRISRHYEKYHSKGLEVIGISLDTDRDALDQYLARADFAWPVIHDSDENPLETLQMKFGISQLPTMLLLNKEGTVVSLEAHGAELDRLLQMLLDAPIPAPPPVAEAPADGSGTRKVE